MSAPVQPKRDRVLVIDDDRGPRESLRYLLNLEFEVHCAEHVLTGLEIFRQVEPHVVILDIRMPGLSGIDGLREIRKLDPHVAVIMLTGFGTLETAQDALRLGANDYLRKPFDANELLEVVRRNVERAKLNRRRAQVEETLRELNHRLTQELANREQFARLGVASAALVHDLRNPLSVVFGYFSLLADQLRECREKTGFQVPPLQDLSEYLDAIEHHLNRCRELTDLWHELGRMDPRTAQTVRVVEIVQEVSRDAAKEAAAVGSALRVAEGPSEAQIRCHPVQLRRALLNIVRNAIQAAEPGQGLVEIGWETLPEGGVALFVRDNGSGIPPEVIAHLAEPFFTTRKTQGGTGLGLFIAQQVATSHGGKLTAQNRPEGGVEVRIVLPLAPSECSPIRGTGEP